MLPFYLGKVRHLVHCSTNFFKQGKSRGALVGLWVVDGDLVEEAIDRGTESSKRGHGVGKVLPLDRRDAPALERRIVCDAMPQVRRVEPRCIAVIRVLDEDTVTAALLEACSVHIGHDGFTAPEAERAIRNGLGYAARRRTPG